MQIGNLTSWNVNDSMNITVNDDFDYIYNGSKSIKVDATGGIKYLYQSQTYPAGKPYPVGAWFKAQTSMVNVIVFRDGASWQWKTITTSDAWVYITCEALSNSAVHQTQLLVNGGIAYVDMADLEEMVNKDQIYLQLAPALELI